MKLGKLFFALTAMLMIGACSKSVKSPFTKVSLSLQATTTSGKTSIGGRIATPGKINSLLELTDFKISVSEIKFEFGEEDQHFNKNDSTYDDDDDKVLKGPFIVDLLDGSGFVKNLVTSLNLPNANYKKVKFKLAKVNDPASVMNGKSIYITGKYDGKPFVIWDNSSEEFKISFADPAKHLTTSGNQILLDIKIFLDKAFGEVDLTQFTDVDNDGVIEIDADNNDGHHDLENKIIDALEDSSDLEQEN